MAQGKLFGLLLSMLASQAAAQMAWTDYQWLSPGTWSGSVEYDTGFSGDSSTSDGVSTTFKQHNNNYILNLQNAGFSVLDPSLITGTLGLTLGMNDDTSKTQGASSTVSSGLLGYSFQAEVLNDTPYGGALFANKSKTNTMQAFGRQEINTSYRGLSLRLNEGSPLKDMGLPYLSANFRLEQQELDQLSTSALNQNYQYSESRKSLVQDGHKGGVSSDLNWRFEVNDVHLPLNPDGDNRNMSAGLDYSIDFGERLNRRWDSHINYSDRTGATELYNLSTRSISEALQVTHLNNLSSSYSYQRMEVVTRGISSVNQTGAMSVQYQPYQNLSTSASLQRQSASTGVVDSGSLGFGYQYQHALPWQGRLHFTTSGSYGLTRNTNTTGATTGRVDFEAHPLKFDPLAVNLEITLGQRFVDTAVPIGVYAVNSKLNLIEAALVACPGSTLPNDGTCDYIVETLGNQTVIRLNPLSTTLTGLANTVDTLAVSYLYNVPPSQTYDSVSSSSTLALDYNWIIFTLAHTQSKMSLRSEGDSAFLQSGSQNRAQVDLHGDWHQIQGAAGASYQVSNDTLLTTRQSRYYGSASYPYSYALSLALNADLMMNEFQNPDRSSDTYSLRASMNWRPMNDLSVSAYLARRSSSDSRQETETVNEANLKAQLRYGKIRLASSLSLNNRVRGSSELNNWRIDLNLLRDL